MDLLPDGAVVRLRSRARGGYLHADEDRAGLSLSPRRASASTAWVVRRVVRGEDTCFVLRGAAYGLYLALSPELKTGRRAVAQRELAAPGHPAAMWNPISVWAEAGRRYLLVRHVFGTLAPQRRRLGHRRRLGRLPAVPFAGDALGGRG
ncbi:unnamed protein product [Urochloa humidicola]